MKKKTQTVLINNKKRIRSSNINLDTKSTTTNMFNNNNDGTSLKPIKQRRRFLFFVFLIFLGCYYNVTNTTSIPLFNSSTSTAKETTTTMMMRWDDHQGEEEEESGIIGQENANKNENNYRKKILLQNQVDIQHNFQHNIIHRRQYPSLMIVDSSNNSSNKDIDLVGGGCTSATTRFLVVQPQTRDGFALEVQVMARLLQVAIATNRTLVISSKYRSAYEPPNNDCNFREVDVGDGNRDDLTTTNTNRTTSTKTMPSSSSNNVGWNCLWKPVTSCTEDHILQSLEEEKSMKKKSQPKFDLNSQGINGDDDDDEQQHEQLGLLLDVGIISEKSKYFNTQYYGSTKVVNAPVYPWSNQFLIDTIPHFERSQGRFWIRAQMAHYLWHPSRALKQQISQRVPKELIPNYNDDYDDDDDSEIPMSSSDLDTTRTTSTDNEPYMAFHVRFTDNIYHLQRDFGRNATITRSFSQFMKIAQSIRHRHLQQQNPSSSSLSSSSPTRIQKIFVATDNKDIILNEVLAQNNNNKNNKWDGWDFIFQKNVQRSNSTNFMWFKNGRSTAGPSIATDLEVMRSADYLVGSFQSNVYRLATELNTAYHVSKYPINMHRHYSVDVEWYEDP